MGYNELRLRSDAVKLRLCCSGAIRPPDSGNPLQPAIRDRASSESRSCRSPQPRLWSRRPPR